MLLDGVVLVMDSKLNFEKSLETMAKSPRATIGIFFYSTMTLAFWALTEIFLVAVGLIYFKLIYRHLKISHYFLLLRLCIMLVAVLRLWRALKAVEDLNRFLNRESG